MPGFAYQITVSNSAGASQGQVDLAKAAVDAALKEYAKYVSGQGTVDVNIVLEGPASRAGISVQGYDSFARTANGVSRNDSPVAAKLMTGVDPNGASSDLTITINTDAFGLYWWGNRSSIPTEKVDAVSKLLAEMSGAFNLFTHLNPSTGVFNNTPVGTLWDDNLGHLLQRVAADVSPTGWAFFGANAMAIYGKPIPFGENFQTSFAGLDFRTLPLSVFGASDVLTGVTPVWATASRYDSFDEHLQPGKAYSLSALDLAIIKDLNPALKVTIPQKGTALNDTYRAVAGTSDIYDGLDGRDTVVESFARSAYTTVVNGDGTITVTSKADPTDVDVFTNVERIHFGDGVLIFDGGANAAAAYRLYQAAFARVPDEGGLLVQAHLAFDVLVPQKATAGASTTDKVAGFTISSAQYLAEIDVAARFLTTPEFIARYGTNVTDGQFVDLLYQNVLGRLPDDAGRAHQVGALQSGLSRATLLTHFAESAENVARTAPNTTVGLWSTVPDPAYG